MRAPPQQPQASPTPAPAATAPAPEVQPADDLGDEEEIVITGAARRAVRSLATSRPKTRSTHATSARPARPTSTSCSTRLRRRSAAPAAVAASAPVLLLNGQRISSFRELRDIPTEAIQRVDILPEEVALKYGYRADQKVVNIVLRQRFRSTAAQVGAGVATDGGYANGNARRHPAARSSAMAARRSTFMPKAMRMLTEAERNILLDPATDRRHRSTRRLPRARWSAPSATCAASATINRQVLGDVSGTLNAELEHNDGRSLIGLNSALLEPLARDTTTRQRAPRQRAQRHDQVAVALDRDRQCRPRSQHHADRPRQCRFSAGARARDHRVGRPQGTANGNLFKLPAGNATTTLTLGGSTVHLDSTPKAAGHRLVQFAVAHDRHGGVNLDLPISRREPRLQRARQSHLQRAMPRSTSFPISAR